MNENKEIILSNINLKAIVVKDLLIMHEQIVSGENDVISFRILRDLSGTRLIIEIHDKAVKNTWDSYIIDMKDLSNELVQKILKVRNGKA